VDLDDSMVLGVTSDVDDREGWMRSGVCEGWESWGSGAIREDVT
jgi:hypothetical protein